MSGGEGSVGATPVEGSNECPFCGGDSTDDKHKRNEVEPKCPNSNDCGRKDRCPGTNAGSGEKLGSAISHVSGIKRDVHPLKGKEVPQAHHLICSESMDNNLWEKICKITGYNINCYKNGVYLPADMRVACKFRVPLHKGGHSAGFGLAASINYPSVVKKEIAKVLKKFENINVCESDDTIKSLINDLNAASVRIFEYVKKFVWTITWDGFDYEPLNPIGCGKRTSVQDKQGTRRIKKEDGTTEAYKYSDAEKIDIKLFKDIHKQRVKNQSVINKGIDEAVNQKVPTIDAIESTRADQKKLVEDLHDKDKYKDIVCKRVHDTINTTFENPIEVSNTAGTITEYCYPLEMSK